MELFRNPQIDWLSKKWYFLGFSLIFSIAGLFSLFFWHGLPLDVDFRGGTVVQIRFADTPDFGRIHNALDSVGLHDAHVVSFGAAAGHAVLITLPQDKNSETALDQGRATIISALEQHYAKAVGGPGKIDVDTAGSASLLNFFEQANPLHLSGDDAETRYQQQAQAIQSYRDTAHGGLISSIGELRSVADPAVVSTLEANGYLSGFNVRSVEAVGPQVGAQLKKQAILATVYSLIGMLVYLWFRFELIYGVAAVVAVFHDTLITVGAFSLADKEVSLTVIAAMLTLIGYSMNDTIVVFDRIRENLREARREPLADLVNRSINQTLSRTVLTSGLTFLTVLSLFLFGGEVLHPFSFALVVGILIGTYSSIAVAAPMLVAWQERKARKTGRRAELPATRSTRA